MLLPLLTTALPPLPLFLFSSFLLFLFLFLLFLFVFVSLRCLFCFVFVFFVLPFRISLDDEEALASGIFAALLGYRAGEDSTSASPSPQSRLLFSIEELHRRLRQEASSGGGGGGKKQLSVFLWGRPSLPIVGESGALVEGREALLFGGVGGEEEHFDSGYRCGLRPILSPSTSLLPPIARAVLSLHCGLDFEGEDEAKAKAVPWRIGASLTELSSLSAFSDDLGLLLRQSCARARFLNVIERAMVMAGSAEALVKVRERKREGAGYSSANKGETEPRRQLTECCAFRSFVLPAAFGRWLLLFVCLSCCWRPKCFAASIWLPFLPALRSSQLFHFYVSAIPLRL